MMKSKKIIKLFSIFLICLTAINSIACGSKTGGKNKLEVWGAYSSLKVMQDQYNYEKLPAKIDISMAQGEVESGQIIFTPNTNVKSFDVVVSDLKSNNGNVFKKENVEVYVQKYFELTEKTKNQTNTFYPIGWYPDMLLPLETAKEYGENTVSAGKNQGITIDFTTPDGFPAGIYTGEFKLIIDNKTFNIPVSIEVWDFSVFKSYGKTCFVLYQWKLGEFGEYDNTDAMYKAYYDTFLNKYKQCVYLLPNTYDLEKFIPTLLEYWENPNFTSFCLPQSENDMGSQNNLNAPMIEEYLFALAKNSTPDRVLLDKAYYYPIQVDEPADTYRRKLLERIFLDLETAQNNALNRLEEIGYFDDYGGIGSKYYERIKDALVIDLVITTSDVEYFGNNINCYCPPITFYNTQYLDEKYADAAKNNNGEKWYYTCMQPAYPYPSHHMDDYLLGARIMRWMQKEYNLEGYLYWNIATASKDPYNNPTRFTDYPGDGYFLFPGKKYNSSVPFGSLRALTLRDGQEDLNMLCEYEKIITELNKYYEDISVSVNDVLNSEFEALYTKFIYNTSDSNFFAIRDLTAKKILAAKSPAKYLSTKGINANGKNQFTVYVSNGTSIEINNHKLTGTTVGNGLKFEYEIPDNELGKKITVKITKDDYSCTLNEIEVCKVLQKDIVSLATNVTMSDGSSKTIEDNALNFTIISKGATIVEQLGFTPYINLNNVFSEKFDKIDNVSFTLENNFSLDFSIVIKIIDDNGKSQIVEKVLLKANQATEIIIKKVYSFNTKGAQKLKTIKLEFENLLNGEMFASRSLKMSNFKYTIKEGK